MPKNRRGRIKAAKKKIVELVSKGVRINLSKASDFTVQAIRAKGGPGGPAAKEIFKRADTQAGSMQSHKFDSSVDLAKRKKSSGHR